MGDGARSAGCDERAEDLVELIGDDRSAAFIVALVIRELVRRRQARLDDLTKTS